jgi:nucleoside-diphosphate-sugar epimerase
MNAMSARSLQPDYAGTRTLVLGSAGFIGRWVARALTASGAMLWGVVRDATLARQVFNDYAIDASVVELDVRDAVALANLYREVRPSITFNCAGYGVDHAERDDDATWQLNTGLIQTLCDVLERERDATWGGRHIVHVGSGAEYGDHAADVDENAVTTPRTAYGLSKLAGTRLLTEHCKTNGINGATIRLFTVYGPGEHPDRLLPSLLNAARTRQPLQLTTGLQQRDFTFVEDVADGLLRVGLRPGRPGQVANLATGQLLTVRAFAETAARVLGIPGDLLHFGTAPPPSNDVWHSAVPLSRLRQLLDWVPPTPVAEGIARTACFQQSESGRRDRGPVLNLRSTSA